jgi:hypothetical protein
MKTLTQIKSELKSGKLTKAEALLILKTMKADEQRMSKLRQTAIIAVELGTMSMEEAVAVVEDLANRIDYKISNYK